MEMFAPKEYSGTLMELAQSRRGERSLHVHTLYFVAYTYLYFMSRRGEYVDMKFLTEKRVSIKYDLPLAEVRTKYKV